MQLTISGKQSYLGDALRGYIEELWSVLVGRYFENLTVGHNTMLKQGTDIRVILLQGYVMADDALAASCEATEHVCTWLRRCKWRLRDHNGTGRTIGTIGWR